MLKTNVVRLDQTRRQPVHQRHGDGRGGLMKSDANRGASNVDHPTALQVLADRRFGYAEVLMPSS
jgi:hypothetical protein